MTLEDMRLIDVVVIFAPISAVIGMACTATWAWFKLRSEVSDNTREIARDRLSQAKINDRVTQVLDRLSTDLSTQGKDIAVLQARSSSGR